jgi:formylglycine-generating enzyme required for sulfatase activity
MPRLSPVVVVLLFVTVNICDAQTAPNTGSSTNSSDLKGAQAGDRRELGPGIAFRWCPAGSFTMGSPKSEIGFPAKTEKSEDQVNVTLSSGFWMAESELTQDQWQKLMGTSPWKAKYQVKEGSDFPATYVNHEDAVSFCQKLTSEERTAGRLPKDWKYSLPTEAQWEYACRAGTTTKFSFGEEIPQLADYGWFKENAFHQDEKYAHQVGLKKANPWGLKDMHGNVWEWCSDWYGDRLSGGQDPAGPPSGSYRSIRGGSWGNYAAYCRSANRGFNAPGNRTSEIGFRIVAVPVND